MASYYDRNYYEPRRPDSYYPRSRGADGYSRHAPSSSNNHSPGLTDMRGSLPYSSSSANDSRYDRYAAQSTPPPLPKRSSAYSYRPSGADRYNSRKRNTSTWPPSPSVEDEVDSLAKEWPSVGSTSDEDDEARGPRGAVDQYPIIEDIEQPRDERQFDDRRFVLVSDPSADADSDAAARDRRRKSFAERGNMPYLKTDIDDAPVIPQRKSTPYAYTKPPKESTAPSPGDYFLSPEPITPNAANIPRSVPARDTWDSRDQKAKPTRPTHSRNDSLTQSPRTPKNDVFEDSDSDADADADGDTTYLRTERKPARYSFVKSDLQKEDLRTNVLESQAQAERRRSERPQSRPSSRGNYDRSSGSSKDTSRSHSPRTSESNLSHEKPRSSPRSRPDPIDTTSSNRPRKYSDSRPASPLPVRPRSPLHRERPSESPPSSPKLPPRRRAESTSLPSRPSSRSDARPQSPLAYSETLPPPPPPPPRVPVSEADWHATYPPTSARDRAPRFARYDSMPVPMPRIDVQSPSPSPAPVRSSKPPVSLPYPVDDRPIDVSMPAEGEYQFDHSLNSPSVASSTSFRQGIPDSPRVASSPITTSPRETQSAFRPSMSNRHTATEDVPRLQRPRSSSNRSQSSLDGRRGERKRPLLTMDKPLPSCPRSQPSANYEQWFTMENTPNFDMCPTCYEGVFADTPFAYYFKRRRPQELTISRYCDFSSPWMRLAWLLTVKQQRERPDLICALARIFEKERPCPNEREIANGIWFGIPDPRDGRHIANFVVCPCDKAYLEALFPSVRGYFTMIPPTDPRIARKYTCSIRATSRRFPKYLDLLVDLDEEALKRNRPVNFEPFIQLARAHAFKGECQRDKALFHKGWHFIPQLPEFTVCEECYDDVIRPADQDRNKLASMFFRAMQPLPDEDIEGTSCCLYSNRMRRVWDRVAHDEDFKYLKRKAVERKQEESRLNRRKRDLEDYIERAGMYMQGSVEVDKARRQLRDVEDEWKEWE